MKSIEIIKNNKKRKILLLDDREKLLRKEAKDEIEKYLTINDNVYSFRKGKSVKMAINKIKRNIDSYRYFMKLDIENYYGTTDGCCWRNRSFRTRSKIGASFIMDNM